MKPCKKCGVLIDEKSGDLCEKCIQIANGAYNTYEKVPLVSNKNGRVKNLIK